MRTTWHGLTAPSNGPAAKVGDAQELVTDFCRDLGVTARLGLMPARAARIVDKILLLCFRAE